MRLAAIINSFNRLELLKTALPSLDWALRNLPWSSSIILFDAGSTDGSVEWVEEFAASAKANPCHLLTAEPAGPNSFSAGVNRAAAFALKRYPELELFFLFETDNWIAGAKPLLLADALLDEQPDLAAVGFTVRNHQGEPVGYGCPFPTLGQFIIGPQLTHRLRLDRPDARIAGRVREVPWRLCDAVYTSPLVVRRSAWTAGGELDEQTFPFADTDIDWAWRLFNLGWRMAVLETDEVVHDNRAILSQWSANRSAKFHRARLALLRRHRGKGVIWARPLLFLRHLAETLILGLREGFDRSPQSRMSQRRELLARTFKNYE